MMKLQFRSDQQAVAERFSNVFNGDELKGSLLVRKNQTTDIIANCLEIQNSYIENLGFTDFVEVTR